MGPGALSRLAKKTLWASSCQVVPASIIPSSSHCIWSAPRIVRSGSSCSAQSVNHQVFPPSWQAWRSRYWRVSSTWKVARSPQCRRRKSWMEEPTGALLRRSGMFS